MCPCKGHIANATEGNWNSKKQEGVKETVRRLRKLEREIKERIGKDNMLESKMT